MHRRQFVASAALAPTILVVACETVEPSLKASGEPLAAHTHSQHVEADVNGRGEFVPAHDVVIFDGHRQGGAKIDEIDFYAIAGDTHAVEAVAEYRQQTNLATFASLPIVAVGTAGFAAAGVVYLASDNRDSETFTDTPNGQAVLGLAFGGLALDAVGFGVYYLLSPDTKENGIVLPYKKAVETADAYNATLPTP